MFVEDEEEKKKEKEKKRQKTLDKIIEEYENKLKEQKEELSKTKKKQEQEYGSSGKKIGWFGRLWRCMLPAGAVIGVGCGLWLANQAVIWGASLIEATKGRVNLESSVVGIIKTATFWKFVGFVGVLGLIAFCFWSAGSAVSEKFSSSKDKKKSLTLKKKRGKNKKKKLEAEYDEYDDEDEYKRTKKKATSKKKKLSKSYNGFSTGNYYGDSTKKKDIYNSYAKISKKQRNCASSFGYNDDEDVDFSKKNNKVFDYKKSGKVRY